MKKERLYAENNKGAVWLAKPNFEKHKPMTQRELNILIIATIIATIIAALLAWNLLLIYTLAKVIDILILMI